MALLHDILEWSQTLPAWQRDAIRLLLQKSCALEDADYLDLYSLLKAEHRALSEGLRKAQPLTEEHLPIRPPAGSEVVLKAVQNFENVNRIAPGQVLEFNPTGLTVIYGGNGTGKSGYTRVMKKACRARDTSEPIHGNANDPRGSVVTPSAELVIENDGSVQTLAWSRGSIPPAELSAISVFDSRCARSYLTAEQEVAYLPYGLDLIENLANRVLPELTRRLEAEITAINTERTLLEHLRGESRVGRMVESLTHESEESSIKALGTLSQEEGERLAFLQRALDERDPAVRGQELKLLVTRLKGFVQKLNRSASWVSDDAVAKLKGLCERKAAAEEAEGLAAKALVSGEDVLRGTGELVWKELYEAARRYSSEVAYPSKTFPHIHHGALCPLCQEPLPESAARRLVRFEQYIKNDIAKKAAEERAKLKAIQEKIEGAVLRIPDEAATRQEIGNLYPDLVPLIEAFEESLEGRKAAMLGAVPSGDWEPIPTLAHDPRRAIRNLAAAQLRGVRTFRRAGNADKRKELEAEKLELTARKKLSEALTAVLALLGRLKSRAALERCREGLKTKAISDKSKEFASIAIINELKAALDTEFAALGIGHIKTKLKDRASKGKLLHQILLDLPVASKLEEILSEGEQRAIALGSFMAELSLANHKCGIILDDPVSSLDHKRRSLVARRLVKESKRRQVIVFTHEIVFLQQMRDACEREGIEPRLMSLDWNGESAGFVQESLPWGHKSTADRIDLLEKKARIMEPWPANPSAEQANEIIRCYSFLRATIERSVQEILLNRTVERFRDYIEVAKIKGVVGIPQGEVDEILRLTQRCHDLVEAHDPASAKDEPPPTVVELKKDISDLKAVIEQIRLRRKAAGSN